MTFSLGMPDREPDYVFSSLIGDNVIPSLIAMAPPQGGNAGAGGGMIQTLIFFGLIFVVFYFMILRPQQKRNKDRQKMLESIKKGDKVVTSGGMHGKVINIDEKTALIEVDDNVKIKFDRNAIAGLPKESASE
jgi:preprotein translocase subunit YajC